MSPEDARVRVVRGEIERDWEMVLANAAAAASVDPAMGKANAVLIALSLDHAYQAFETMLVRVERALGLPERGGGDWHRAILADATLPLPGLRPALVSTAAERDWDELRRFRHFLRHAYSLDLEADKLVRGVARLAHAVAATDPHVRALLRAIGA